MNNFDSDKFNDYFLNEIFLPIVSKPEDDIFRNTLDPFSAKIDILVNSISPDAWIKREKVRKEQKTLQNIIGKFHQKVAGFIDGWDDLAEGSVIDVVNHERKIIAEIKNKYNTTKGNHKMAVYDDLNYQINNNYIGYTSYYVEILPSKQKIYDQPFTPSDNRTHTTRNANENIRRIDGLSWYTLVSGDKNFVIDLYNKHLNNAIIFSDMKTGGQYLENPLKDELLNNDLFELFLGKAYLLD